MRPTDWINDPSSGTETTSPREETGLRCFLPVEALSLLPTVTSRAHDCILLTQVVMHALSPPAGTTSFTAENLIHPETSLRRGGPRAYLRRWARGRHVYGTRFGYPGGIQSFVCHSPIILSIPWHVYFIPSKNQTLVDAHGWSCSWCTLNGTMNAYCPPFSWHPSVSTGIDAVWYQHSRLRGRRCLVAFLADGFRVAVSPAV